MFSSIWILEAIRLSGTKIVFSPVLSLYYDQWKPHHWLSSKERASPKGPFFCVSFHYCGLLWLIENVHSSLSFHPFKLSYNLEFDILQFTEDTIIVGQASWETIWSIKVVLHGFELITSGLCVNFYKNLILGFNVDSDFLMTTSDFLSCAISLFPFTFLGPPIGVNPGRRSSWDPILSNLRNKLSSWKGKFASLGGRVIILN